ncbi:MAG: hypothetical protein BMS9Abin07_2096 [Acidimicrobiia bacterium]|nr:MAG: hypothetical protein BMS9Abin07_2096 [Acidimicrobiia bacterium]
MRHIEEARVAIAAGDAATRDEIEERRDRLRASMT